MTIYAPRAQPFICAICSRPGPPQWENINRRTIAPICFPCEVMWGRSGGFTPSSMDARLTAQIGALASILSATANCLQHGSRHPYG